MYFASFLATAAVLASTASAAVIPKDAEIDAYVGDLRTYTQFGCDADNQGVGTFTHSMTSACNVYAASFGSLYIHMTSGWQFRAHNTPNCTDDGVLISETLAGSATPIVCNNQTADLGPWVAYSVFPLTD